MPPDAWIARVFEAAMKIKKHRFDILDDENVSAVLLQMRIGEFKEFNLNGVRRYSRDLFRCHICNTVLRTKNGVPPSTAEHIGLHRRQVIQALRPDVHFTDDWSGTIEPTLEEVQALDDKLEFEARCRDKANELFTNVHLHPLKK